MNSSKPWYLSKTIWAAMVSVAATVSGMAGVPVEENMRNDVVESILQLVAAGGGLFAIFGRLSASSRID